jgi:hypothetical protein
MTPSETFWIRHEIRPVPLARPAFAGLGGAPPRSGWYQGISAYVRALRCRCRTADERRPALKIVTRTDAARPRIAVSRRGTDTDVPPPSGRGRSVARRCRVFGKSTAAVGCRVPPQAPHSLLSHQQRPRLTSPATMLIRASGQPRRQAGRPFRVPAKARFAACRSDSTRPTGCIPGYTSRIGRRIPRCRAYVRRSRRRSAAHCWTCTIGCGAAPRSNSSR